MCAVLQGPSLPAQQATSTLSNIVPWAPAAAAASTPSRSVPPAVLQKSTCDEVPAALPLTAADNGSEHAAAAEAGAAQESVDITQPAEQLVLVYLNTSSSSNSAPAAAEAAPGIQVEAPSVRYFRLPQEQQQYESAVQQGCRAVPLPWALQRGAGGAMSMEELAWLNQQQGCWGLDVAAQDLLGAAAACAAGGDGDAVAGTEAAGEVSVDANVGAAGGGEVPGSEQQQQQPTAAAEVAAAMGAGEVSGSRDDSSSGSGTVKVRQAAAAAHGTVNGVWLQLLKRFCSVSI